MRDAPPRASAMVEALRGLGYSPATALADIIDNSIAARATAVDLQFVWAGGDSHILVLDNGDGMDDAGLDLAMRLGDRSPLDARDVGDLGRFGLGLKTASFSQCRRLTVASRRAGITRALRWDLDVLLADRTGRWSLLENAHPGSETRLAPLDAQESGTAVLWELMDRVTPPGRDETDFLDQIDRIERHLAMVFHRYITGRRLVIRINGRAVEAWDPFLEHRTDTWRSRPDRFVVNGYPVAIQGYVLPHRDRLDARTLESAAGPDGWTAQQGFYVYRNERLLVAGSWLGLGRGRSWTKDEPFRLARIRIDLPNIADADWQIDIRKSTARPPMEARQRLTVLAEDVRSRARRVFAFRGSPQSSGRREPLVQAWKQSRTREGIRYRIDTGHPAVAAVLDGAGELDAPLRAMLRVIEDTVPVQQIWLDTAEARDTPPISSPAEPPPEVVALMGRILASMVRRKGLTVEAARAEMARTDPFNNWPDYLATLDVKMEDEA
ncbi:ATP-binding protein [Brevundimonas sp.]|uniref:ATP-binding protein n=1 Tax=Brevundimonas sp. TaxID=1871086 RepID=UPI0035B4C7CB